MPDSWLNETEHTACFTGHRDLPADIIPRVKSGLASVIANVAKEGYDRFICGGALGFDTLAAQAVLEHKKEHPEVQLLIAVPCKTQSNGWSTKDQEIYRQIISEANEVRILAEKYTRGCMQTRNMFMVDRSSLCIAWLTSMNGGGTMNTVKYALKQSVRVINVAMEK